MKKNLFGIIILLLSIILTTIPVNAAGKVTLTPTSQSLTETQSMTVQVSLQEPIIGPGPGQPYFNLNITSSDPSRVSIVPNPIEFTSNDWSQVKQFTITALQDGVHNISNSITISFAVDSDSEFYNQYSGSFVLSVADVDPAPIVQSADTQQLSPKSTLADTGKDLIYIQTLSLLTIFLSLIILRKFLLNIPVSLELKRTK